MRRERNYIENTKFVNRNIPGRTSIEYARGYYRTNKDTVLKSQKEYRNKNKKEFIDLKQKKGNVKFVFANIQIQTIVVIVKRNIINNLLIYKVI